MMKYKLTIGMPTYFDYKGAMFTIRSLIEYHESERVEIIVVDNTSDEKRRKALKSQIDKINDTRVKYYEFPESTGPAEVKNKVFEYAQGEYVMCIDSHVLLERGTVERLLNFLDELPDSEKDNLFSGPLKHSNNGLSSSYKEQWRGEMWGIWDKDPNILNSEVPVEAWANGCGLMLARKDSWLEFNHNFYGFGAEEGYIHEKYRKNGRKFKIIPWMKWWHCFDDPDARRFNLSKYAKVRNYVIGFQELGLDVNEIYNHFVNLDVPESELKQHLIDEHSTPIELFNNKDIDLEAVHRKSKLDRRDWEWILRDPINHKEPENTYVIDLYNKTKDVQNNDLKDHYDIIRTFSAQSDTILNVSRRKLSSIALAAGRPKKLTSLLYSEAQFKWYLPDKVNMEFTESTHNEFPIDELNKQEEHDLVFLKLPHDDNNTREYIAAAISKAKKYFIIHDSSYGYKADMKAVFKDLTQLGWYPVYHNNKLWGLTVFSRKEPTEWAPAWEEEDGPGTELKELFKSYGFEATEGCGCNGMAQKMNFWGPEVCLKKKKEIAKFLEKNGKNWFKTERPSWWTMTKMGWHAIKDKVNPLNPYEGFVDVCVERYLNRINK